jgi:hypothetical protein
VYAAITLTLGSGSIDWASETWRQLLEEPAARSSALDGSAVGVPGEPAGPGVTPASGTPVQLTRQDVWEQTWERFETAPLLGAGADNSSLKLGNLDLGSGGGASAQPQEPNSVVLQVLSDTGVVGAVLGFCAIVVAVAAMLWPRVAVGFGSLRRAWKGDEAPRQVDGGRANGSYAQSGPEDREREGPGRVADAERTAGYRASSRWGEEAMAYGWEMALFGGATYWFVHANMEWLWPVAGVTIPALLMLAAGVAATDARAGIVWPRLSGRWRRPNPDGDAEGSARKTRWLPYGRLTPPGPLSQAFRIALIALSAFVVILAGSAYLLLK